MYMPPLLLLLYPIHLFRRLFICCGFRRWDILPVIMDTFQGWYKDGTEGTYDYRPVVPWLVNVVVSELINIHSAGRCWISGGKFKCGFALCARVA